jgi:hypothetical protein
MDEANVEVRQGRKWASQTAPTCWRVFVNGIAVSEHDTVDAALEAARSPAAPPTKEGGE